MPTPQILDASDVTKRHLEAKPGEQASDVYLLKANGTGALGDSGEKRGFAKYAYDTSDPANVKKLGPTTETSALLYEPSKEMYKAKGGADGDRALLARSVASTKVDSILGTNMLCQEAFAKDADGRTMGVSIEADGAAIRSNWSAGEGQPEKSCILEIDYSDPAIQRGLSDLQVLDYVTGQIDRHPGNIVIDPETKRVKGIDNDLAFPERDREQLISSDGGVAAKAPAGVPKQIHTETAARILATDPEKLAEELRNMPVPDGCQPLSEAEINGAKQRLEELQTAIRNPQENGVTLVDKFNDQTYEDAVKVQTESFKAARRWNKDPGVPDFGSKNPSADALVYAEVPEAERAGDRSRNTPTRNAIFNLSTDLGNTPATSYLGSVLTEKKRNELGKASQPENYGMRPAGTANKAERSMEAVDQKIAALAQERDALRQKMADYERRLTKLESPNLELKIRSLRYGGVDNAKQAFIEKEADAAKRLRELDKKMENLTQTKRDVGVDPIQNAAGRIAELKGQNEELRQKAQAPAVGAAPALTPQQLDNIVKRQAPALLAESNTYGSAQEHDIDYQALAKASALNALDRKGTPEEVRVAEKALIGGVEVGVNQKEIEAIEAELGALDQHTPDPAKLKELNDRMEELEVGMKVSDARLQALNAPVLNNRAAIAAKANAKLEREKLGEKTDGYEADTETNGAKYKPQKKQEVAAGKQKLGVQG